MNVFNISAVYPPGTKARIKEDDPGTIHEVYGYEWFGDAGNIISRDGKPLRKHLEDRICKVTRFDFGKE